MNFYTFQTESIILAAHAADPSPRSDWSEPPFSFEEVVGEAVGSLTPQ